MVLRYEDGKEVEKYKSHFMPEKKFTKSARRVNGFSMGKLKELGAKVFTPGASKILVNFLNQKKDLPIVAHNVKYDRDQVLTPAFKRVKTEGFLPPEGRWKCTFEMTD